MIINDNDEWKRSLTPNGKVWELVNSNGKARLIYNDRTAQYKIEVYANLKHGGYDQTYEPIEGVCELSDAKIIGEIELRRMWLEYNGGAK